MHFRNFPHPLPPGDEHRKQQVLHLEKQQQQQKIASTHANQKSI